MSVSAHTNLHICVIKNPYEKFTLFFINKGLSNKRKKPKIDDTVIFSILQKSATIQKNDMYLCIDMIIMELWGWVGATNH